MKKVYCSFCYVTYLILRELLRRIRDTRRLYQILLSLLSAIALTMVPPCSDDFICFANSSGPNSGWCNRKSFFSAAHLSVVVSKNKCETTKEALRNTAADIVFSSNDDNSDMVGKEVNRSSITMSWPEGLMN